MHTETIKKTDDEPNENKQISPPTTTAICEPVVDVKSDTPTTPKKKIVKVKTVKTGTKSVKIKSEKTTTVTLENGVTEVKKKTVNKQTDTTTIQLPNGVTNGVTSEECTVTNSIHTTNGDQLIEEKNIEITSSHTDVISPLAVDEELDSLTERRSSSLEIDSSESKADDDNRLKVSINGFDEKSLRKDRSASPIEIASYNFVVGKKNLKQKLVTESENCLNTEVDVSIVNQSEPKTIADNCHETNGTLNVSEKSLIKAVDEQESQEQIASNSDCYTKTSQRSETSPARFQIKLNDSSTVPSHQYQNEATAPFLRSEVSPARFTIKLAKKKVETAASKDELNADKELSAEPVESAKPVDCSTKEADPSRKSELEVNNKFVKAVPKDEVDRKEEIDKDIKPTVEINPKIEINCKRIDSESPAEFESISESKIAPVVDVTPKVKIGCQTEATPKIDTNNTEVVPKIKIVRKSVSNADVGVGVKTVKSKIGIKAESEREVSPKAEVGLKEVVLKKTKKLGDAKVVDVNGLSAEGTTEVKKKLVRKVKDSTSPITGEVKKKVVKKVIGATTTENGTGEVKKLIKKKPEVINAASDFAPEIKVKVTKKKSDAVATDSQVNAVHDPTQSNNIKHPKVEDCNQPVTQTELEKVLETKTVEETIETKMDDEHNELRNDISPFDTLGKKEFDPTLPLPDEDGKDRAMLLMDDDLPIGGSTMKYYDEIPLFISTTQQEQHDLTLGLSLSDKNRRDRQMLGMDEDLALGASASPVESKSETSNNYIPLAICDTPSSSTDYVAKLFSGKTHTR